MNIGKSVVIKGELNGSEDLTIEGQVEGKIELRQNVLTIGANGRIKAQVFAKAVIILGEVTGNVTATEKVDIRDNGSVDGDIASPRVAIAEGAHFRGAIDMQRAGDKDHKDKTRARSRPPRRQPHPRPAPPLRAARPLPRAPTARRPLRRSSTERSIASPQPGSGHALGRAVHVDPTTNAGPPDAFRSSQVG